MPKNQGRKNAFLSILDFFKSYWPILTVLAGIIGTIATIPSRLQAVEKKAEVVEQRTEKIEGYIDAIEEQKQLIKAAPPGWKWDETAGEYVVYKDDPRLRKK